MEWDGNSIIQECQLKISIVFLHNLSNRKPSAGPLPTDYYAKEECRLAELTKNYKIRKTYFIDVLCPPALLMFEVKRETIFCRSQWWWWWHENLSQGPQVPFYDNFSHIELNMAISMSVLDDTHNIQYQIMYNTWELQDFSSSCTYIAINQCCTCSKKMHCHHSLGKFSWFLLRRR